MLTSVVTPFCNVISHAAAIDAGLGACTWLLVGICISICTVVLSRPMASAAQCFYLVKMLTTSSLMTWCERPTFWGCGLNLLDLPHTRAYLKWDARPR